ncbi:ASKHA domain-containing protein [Cucumibacter marinus]|uniref:ASKHA domain-containing protein n=1 Tax=Cucumibacter marinus TaxID=1121252 RepID=UPI00040B9DC1|nr:ASKHA domain-containing protein [Cucumibacter marinus]
MADAANDALIVFQPSGKRGRFPRGTPVLDAARDLGVYIESVCGGRGICGKCQISVAEGDFAKHKVKSAADHLSPAGTTERECAANKNVDPENRLSCLATIEGDLVVDVPDAFRIAGQTIRKDATTVGMHRHPAVRLCYVEVEESDMHNPLGDADRLVSAIESSFDLENVRIRFDLLQTLQRTLRKADWKVTAAVNTAGDRPEIVSILPGYNETLTGLAVDIGSTTIAAHLVDLMTGEILASTGVANPQIRFGEDLMSRVSYVMMNKGGRENLTEAVRKAINTLVGDLLKMSGTPRGALLDAVFVANPIMHHLFLGLDPTELGQAPFALVQSDAVRCRADEIGISLGKGASVYLLPLIAGHVGADAAAVLLAQAPQREDHPVLIVDVGTNAEILLWDGKAVYAASSPTGPAFEGAEISCGQRAAPGAIERVRIDPETLKASFKIIGTEFWSDRPEFFGASKATGVTGICGSGIIEIIGEMLRAGILSPDGIIRAPRTEAEAPYLVENGRTWSYVLNDSNPRLTITQNDVRAIQLAKAALYAGVRLLMDKADLSELGEIKLAGAFGSYIDPAYALLLGLVPDCAVENVTAVGNAAGQGALTALLDVAQRREIEREVRAVTKIETALEPKFQEHFVAAMGLPNSADPFVKTRTHFDLAPLEPAAQPGDRPRRRRRRER